MTAFGKGFGDSDGGNSGWEKIKRDSSPGGSSSGSSGSTPQKVMQKSVSVQVDSVFGLHLTEGVYEIKRMEPRTRSSRLRSVILICLILAVSGIIGFGYFCNDQVISLFVSVI